MLTGRAKAAAPCYYTAGFGVARPSPECFAGRRVLHGDGKRTVAECGACTVGHFTDNRNVREPQRQKRGGKKRNNRQGKTTAACVTSTINVNNDFSKLLEMNS